jgi:hypothetical protein
VGQPFARDEGFVLLAAWAQLLALIALLLHYVLQPTRSGERD